MSPALGDCFKDWKPRDRWNHQTVMVRNQWYADDWRLWLTQTSKSKNLVVLSNMHFHTPLVLLLSLIIFVNLFSKPAPTFFLCLLHLPLLFFFLLLYQCPRLHICTIWFLFPWIYLGFISPSILFRIQNLNFFIFILDNSSTFISLPSLRAPDSLCYSIYSSSLCAFYPPLLFSKSHQWRHKFQASDVIQGCQ